MLNSQETEDERYLENTSRRCYWCKHEVYGLMEAYARENGFAYLVDGTNFDDIQDHRPGRQAAREYGVRSPLIEAQISKDEVRAMARALGLPNWDKPASACLSSRIPYGTAITIQLLSKVEQGERVLHELGIKQVRVRHHGEIARLEVPIEDFGTMVAQHESIVEAFHKIGYQFVALDLAGYRMGSLNTWIRVADES
jgi:uncharacterized protein